MADIPTRWTALYTEDGEVDGYLQTPLGHLGTGLRIAAVRGGYGGDLDPADLVLVVRRGAEIGLVTLPPGTEVYGIHLTLTEWNLVISFMVQHRSALIAHWSGETDSIELLDQVL